MAGFRLYGVVKVAFGSMLLVALIFLPLIFNPPNLYANGPLPFTEDFETFTGGGFAPNPAAGQLDSDWWAITGLTDGDLLFGDTQTTGDFARGQSTGGVGTGGLYAFDVGGGNTILGVQPTGGDFTPGEFILRLQNSSGVTVTQLQIAYNIWYNNDQPRSNSLSFAYSLDNVGYTPVAALDFTTPPAADGLGWQTVPLSTTITGLTIPISNVFYLKWTGDDLSGSGSRDEYGLDNIQVSLPTGDAPPTVSTTNPPDGAATVLPTAPIQIQFSENVTTTATAFGLECPVGTPVAFNTTPPPPGAAANFTLTPTANLPGGVTCTVTVAGNQITDQDGSPDPMAADYTFTFTTLAPATGWIINEIHADPDATAGDANGDGDVSTTRDEFVELVNQTGSPADISDWTVADGNSVRHTFPAGTTVPDQCALLLFAGGTPTGLFGEAVVQTAGSLGLNNGGDTVTLADAGGSTQATYSYGSEGGDNQSLTRSPDILGPDPLLKHSGVAGAGGRLYSPGTRVDGTPFAGCGLPRVTATTPAPGTVDVAVTPVITIQFSEAVTITANTFAVECPAGSPHPFNPTPSPPGRGVSYSLTAAASLPHSTPCTVTVDKNELFDSNSLGLAASYQFTFTTVASTTSASPATILISEFLYDGTTPATEGDEFVELCNPNGSTVDLGGYKIGDEETPGGGESMLQIPAGTTLAANGCLTVAKDAAQFQARFGLTPTFAAPDLAKYSPWGSGSWSLSNSGDELLLLGPGDEIVDSVAYRNGDYALLGLEPDASAPEPDSLQRVWITDTNSMPNDFVRAAPNPGSPTAPPPPPAPLPAAALPGGMQAFWGHLHAHTSFSDGAGPPHYALALARAAGLHFYGLTDHGWWMSASQWTRTLSQTNAATVPGQFVALRGVEWSHSTAGHINVFNTNTLLQRTDPRFADLSGMYNWLATNPQVIAQFNHPDPSYGGTFDDFALHAAAAPVVYLQEIGNNAQQYTTYEPSFVQSNLAGWRVAPTNNSDSHGADWGADHTPRTGLVAPALTQADLLAARRARRVFATEDANLALALRLDQRWMGSVLTTTGPLSLVVDWVDPDPEPLTLFLYDNNLLLSTVPFTHSSGQWRTTVEALPGHFYWVKAVQADDDIAYSAPVWIEGQAPLDALVISEILPAPADVDWDGDGTADHNDEWIELYNPLDRAVGLGGWRLRDATGVTYNIPLGVSIPAGGYVTFYKAETGISLNNGGDTISLIHPNGTTIDTFSYSHSPGFDETWCRLPDANSGWHDDCLPTPNAPNSEVPPAEPLKVSIFEAKQLAYNAWVRVRGRVTAPPELLGSRTMYIQDDTAGIMIFLPRNYGQRLQPGDLVEVEGNLKTFFEEFEIVAGERSDVDFIEHGPPPPPLPIATTSLLEPYEGRLVMLQGQAVAFRGRSTFWVDDGTGWAKVVIRRGTGINKPFIPRGTPVKVVGIVSQRSSREDPSRDDYRLLPRYPFDLILPETAPAPGLSDWPTFLPDTGN